MVLAYQVKVSSRYVSSSCSLPWSRLTIRRYGSECDWRIGVRYGRDWTKVSQEVLQHLASESGVRLEMRVEITAPKEDGFSDDKVRVVTENATVLEFDQFGFEDD